MKAKSIKLIFITFVSILFFQAAYSATYFYTDPNNVGNDDYVGGDEIVIQDGTYSGKAMDLYDSGSVGNPIVLRAETPGGVILSGSSLRMNGNYCEVKWFLFTNLNKETVAFRSSGTSYADNCRVTECAFIGSTTGSYKWVSFYGSYNRIDHCAFVNCRSAGAMITVWREDPSANYHQIDHNYIANRQGGGVDNNGYETMRIGDSQESQSDSYTIVEYNYISNIYDADIEFISSKSGNNTYRYNTFRACGGGLTLRHGKSCTVEGNFFYGDGQDYTIGIRMTDSGHVIINNYLEALRGHTDNNKDMWNALVMMAGQSSPALNGYWPVEDIIIAHNTFVNNDNTFTIGYENQGGTVAPRNISLANNCVYSPGNTVFDNSSGNTVGFGSGLVSEGNIMYGGSLGSDAPGSGINWTDPLLTVTGDYWRPDTGSPCINSAAGTYSMVSTDMDGQDRDDGQKDVGADEVSANPVVRGLLAHTDTGPPWYWGLLGPDKPSALVLNPVSTSQINISWTDGSSDEGGFYIYRNTVASRPPTPVHTNAADSTAWNDTGLSENTTYYYWITAYNTNGESQAISGSAATLTTPPSAPIALVLNPLSQTQIDLSWTDSSWNEDGFYIYRNTVNSKPGTALYTNTAGDGDWSDTGLTSGTIYYYWVEAYNSAGTSTDISDNASTLLGPPEVVSTDPMDGAVKVTNSLTQLSITFNSNMNGPSVAAAAVISGTGVSGLTYAGGDGTKTIILDISGTVADGSIYSVTIGTAAQTSDGYNLLVPYAFSFTIGDLPGIYVDAQNGNDADPGTPAEPIQTFGEALSRLADTNNPNTAFFKGDFPAFTPATGGTASRPYIFKAWLPADPPVIDCSGSLAMEFNTASESYYIIDGWFFSGNSGGDEVITVESSAAGIEIRGCIFSNTVSSTSTIRFRTLQDSCANSNLFYNCTAASTGIIYYDEDAGTIKDDLIIGNVMYNCTSPGIRVDPNNVLIRNNTILISGAYCIDANGQPETLYNNILLGATTYAVYGHSSSDNHAGDYNCMSNNTIDYRYVNGNGDDLYGLNDLSDTDPLFASLTFGDPDFLRLRTGSPCINAGNPLYDTTVPDGEIDIGAYEYSAGGGGDVTPPVVTITSGPAGDISTNQAFMLTLNASEDFGYISMDGAVWHVFPGGDTNITINIGTAGLWFYGRDELGNTGITNHNVYTWNVSYPVISASIGSFTTNEPFIVTLNADKDWGYFSTNGPGGPYVQFAAPGTNLSINGSTTIYYYGNDGSVSSSTNSVIYTFDTDAPVVSISSGPGFSIATNQAFNIELSTTEANGYYQINGGSWISFTGTTSPINISTTSTLEFYGEDILGNNSGTNLIIYTVSNLLSPAVPTGLNSISVSSSNVEIRWTDNSSNEDGYIVYWNTSSNMSNALSILLLPGTTNHYIDGLESDMEYYIWVAASNAFGLAVSGYINITTELPGESRNISLRIIPSWITADIASARIEGIPVEIEQINLYNINGDLVYSIDNFDTELSDNGTRYKYLADWAVKGNDGKLLPDGLYFILVGEEILFFTVDKR